MGTVAENDLRRGVGRMIGRAKTRALDLLFPPSCVQCRDDLEPSTDRIQICQPCRDELAAAGPSCRRCGRPAASADDDLEDCHGCRDERLAFDTAVGLGVYEGELRRAVLRAKKWTGESTAIALAELLCQRAGDKFAVDQPEVVVPVPMHWSRRLQRGTNGANVLAEIVARRLGVPSARGLIVRRRNTLPQFTLPRSKRFRNVRGAFRLSTAYDLRAERVLLVDDIMTTGATCHEVARVLRSAGAKHISVAIIARAVGS